MVRLMRSKPKTLRFSSEYSESLQNDSGTLRMTPEHSRSLRIVLHYSNSLKIALDRTGWSGLLGSSPEHSGFLRLSACSTESISYPIFLYVYYSLCCIQCRKSIGPPIGQIFKHRFLIQILNFYSDFFLSFGSYWPLNEKKVKFDVISSAIFINWKKSKIYAT